MAAHRYEYEFSRPLQCQKCRFETDTNIDFVSHMRNYHGIFINDGDIEALEVKPWIERLER